ncbi:CueP family metal-binding protein [Propioniciclava sp.]|uniref:CueP family metal-binding protein n=1 Tax=Propioniciclava sp. TaxID=2038686 RepID=UPI00262F107F|nr:CueP family metal-binding protein [Propioniciclava sp.]
MDLRRISLVLAASAVLLASCTAAPAPTTPDAAAPDSTTATTGDVLADAGVAGLSATEAIEHLDASTDARPLPFRASVTGTELVLQAADAEPVTMAVSEDRFYLSVAPYRTRTHECFNHSLATCQGELVGEQVHVTISGDDGTVLVDTDATTYTNGFVGFWLPRGIGATVTVTAGSDTGTVDIRTDDDSPTCLTTLQLG